MTLDLEPCHLVPIWLMIFSSEHCHSGGVLVVAKLKKGQANPNDSIGNLVIWFQYG